MALAINVIERRALSNKMRRQLQPKKTKVRLCYITVYIAAKDIIPPFITKTKRFGFKSGCVVLVENG